MDIGTGFWRHRLLTSSSTTCLPATNGRIEVIRERNANYYVFVFINGVRPGDDLIAASLAEAGAAPADEAENANKSPAKQTPDGKRRKEKEAKSNRPAKR